MTQLSTRRNSRKLVMSTVSSPHRSSLLSKYKSAGVFLLGLTLPLIHRTFSSSNSSISEMLPRLTRAHETSIMSGNTSSNSSTRTPVYFLGIGGPNFMEAKDHPAYSELGAVGKEITTHVKPKAVVVFSAHWSGGPKSIEINAAEQADIIYDFYGFPAHYYEYKYPNKGSPELADKVAKKLAATGVQVDKVDRGLDHGVWVGFLAAFDPVKNPLNVPIVQVSLYNNEDPEQHYRLGQALESLRDEGVLIVGAGMAVHNLRDYRAIRGTDKIMPYASSFDESLKEVATAEPSERQAKMAALARSDEARRAHPTLEHLLPLYISAGAAGADRGERLWTFAEGSLNWAQYRFGRVASA